MDDQEEAAPSPRAEYLIGYLAERLREGCPFPLKTPVAVKMPDDTTEAELAWISRRLDNRVVISTLPLPRLGAAYPDRAVMTYEGLPIGFHVGGLAEPVQVIVHNYDGDETNIWAADPDEAEGSGGVFASVVSAAQWVEYQRLLKAVNEAHAAVIAAAGYDDESGRMAVCCPEWTGDVFPARTWFQVTMSASGDENEWPVRDVEIGRHHDDKTMAEAALAILPEEFWITDAGLGMVQVRKDRFAIERAGWGARTSSCDRCGWERGEHANPGTPVEVPKITDDEKPEGD